MAINEDLVNATHDLIFLVIAEPRLASASKGGWRDVPAEGHSTSELPQITMVANTIKFRKGEYGDEASIRVTGIAQGANMTRVDSIDSRAVRLWLMNRNTSGAGVGPFLRDWDKEFPFNIRLSVGLVKRTLAVNPYRLPESARRPLNQDTVSNIRVRVHVHITVEEVLQVRLSLHDYETATGVRVAVMPCVCGRYVPAFGIDGVTRLLVRDTGSGLWGCVQTHHSPDHRAPKVSCVEQIILASEQTGVPWTHCVEWLSDNDWLFNIAQACTVNGGLVAVSPSIDNSGVGLVSICYTGKVSEEAIPYIVASEPTLWANIAAISLTPEPLKYRDVKALSTIALRWVSLVVDAMSWVYVVLLCTIIPTLSLRGVVLLSGEVVAEIVARVIMPVCLLYDGYSFSVAFEGFLAPIAASLRYFCNSGALVRALWTSPIFLEAVAGALPLVSVLQGDLAGGVFSNVIGAGGGAICLAARLVLQRPMFKALGLQGYVCLYLWNMALQTQVLIKSGNVWAGYAAVVLNLPEALVVLGVVSAVLYNGSDKDSLRQMLVDRTLKGLLTHIGVTAKTFQDERVLAVKMRQGTACLYWEDLSRLISEDFRGFSLRGIQLENEGRVWVAHTTVDIVGQGYNVHGLGSSVTYGGLVGRAGSPSSLMKGCTSEVLSNYYGKSWGGMVTASSAKVTLPLLGSRSRALESVSFTL